MTTPGVSFWTGQRYGWRYLAQRIDGSGQPGEWLDNELPLSDVTLTDVLSGPPQLTATIAPTQARLLGSDGQPLLMPWRTAMYTEQDGQIRSGHLLVASGYNGPKWDLDASGFSGYPKGMGYEGDTSWVEADPLDIVRHIWAHIQGGQDSNLGVSVDMQTRTPARVGKATIPNADGTVSGTGSTDDGPYRLVRWANHDLGKDIDDLAKSTPFDYHERHTWNADKSQVLHYLEFGYPGLGARRDDLRFVLGENVQTIPDIEEDGGDYANHVRMLGAGEGSAMVMGEARVSNGSLRRMLTVDDKTIEDAGRASLAARNEMRRRLSLATTPTVVVRNMIGGAQIGAFGVGDEIRLQADEPWRDIDLWFRVLTMTISPENPEIASLTLLRTDRVV